MTIMASSLTVRNFFPGKNRIRKIREKSGYEILAISDQILLYEHTKMLFYEKMLKFFENFNNFDVFEIAISPTKKCWYSKIHLDLS